MARKQKSLGDIVPEVPAKVQEDADTYASALRSLGRSKGKMNTAKDVLVQSMQDAKVSVVEIDSGNKRIVLTEKEVLKIKKIKSADAQDGEEEDE